MKNCLKNLTWRDCIAHIQVATLLLMVATFPIRMDHNTGFIPRLAMVLAGVFYVIDYLVSQRWKAWQWTRNKWFSVAMIVLYLLTIIWQLWANSYTKHFSVILEQRAGFVVCGVIGLLGLSDKIKLRHVAYTLLFASLFYSLYVLYYAGGLEIFKLSWSEQSQNYALARIEYLSEHIKFNLFLNTTLVFSFFLLVREHLSLWKKIVVIAISFWLLYILALSDGRIGQLIAMMLVAVMIFSQIARFGWKFLVPAIALLVVASAFVLTHNSRMRPEYVSHDPRTVIWETTWEVIKEKAIVGHGVCDAHERLIEIGKNSEAMSRWLEPLIADDVNYWYYVRPHNAYLETWADFGLLGLAIFLFIFAFPLLMKPKQNRLFVFMIVSIFGIQCMVDMFNLIMLFGFSILFFTTNENEEAIA